MVAPSGATQDEIRRLNVSTLLRQIHVHGELSRAELTTRMGLNRSTIKVLVEELSEAGLVVETIPETSARAGRPSHVVGPRTDTAYVLAANIGVDTVTVAAVVSAERSTPGPSIGCPARASTTKRSSSGSLTSSANSRRQSAVRLAGRRRRRASLAPSGALTDSSSSHRTWAGAGFRSRNC